mmetsp:Transcript_95933/g.213507  ORF Transcript_95933/g.213507 Transcript_95933/m.213507 type:complete len:173 (-) Transcript_95933:112-630(-)
MTESSGYAQVHVSGLDADCDDAEVDATLRRIIAGTRQGLSENGVAAEVESEIAGELKEAAAFISCAVVRNKNTGNCKGYCFVAFASSAEAEAAIALLNVEGTEVAGSRVTAQLSMAKARPVKARNPAEELEDIRKQKYVVARPRSSQYGQKYGQPKYIPLKHGSSAGERHRS